MRFLLRNIVLVSAFAVLLLAGCNEKDGKVIPRGTLAEIYAEMLVVDQWIANDMSLKRQADTSFVYAPILEKYGYTPDDYRKSVDHYMHDPERYSRILRTSAEILGERLSELKIEKARLDRIAGIKVYESDLTPEDFAWYLRDSLIMYHDSMSFEADSLKMIYRLIPHETSDTLYEGVAMVIKVDSLAVSDSISLDSLSVVADSLAAVDSVAVKDSTMKSFKKVELKDVDAVEDSLLTRTKTMKPEKLKGLKLKRLKPAPDSGMKKE